MMSFVIKALRTLFFSLDKIIYGLIDEIYSLLITISRTTIFSADVIAEFSSRVYALAGIFMLFKVSLSIINYIINPDDFTDKEKGFASIGKRVVFSLAMLVLVPFVFQEAYALQAIILEENTIMNLVFGTSSNRLLPNDDYVQNAGKQIQFTVMYTFMQPNYDEYYSDSKYPMSSCINTYELNEDGTKASRGDSDFIYALNKECFGTYQNDVYQDDGALSKAFKEYDTTDVYQNYAQGIAQQNFDLMTRLDLVLQKDENQRYLINYRFGVSTAVGIAIVYLFLLFCIDIAARSVKLGFLQMVSPIPILSYIDPKSGKDGIFKTWYQMCISTYGSLFLRLFALYMGIFAITVIGEFTDVITGEPVRGNWLLQVFMIVGILIFAKQLPDILKKMFNVKGDGKFELNPFKKIENEALGGKFISGAAKGVAVGGAVGLAAGASNLLNPGQKGLVRRPLSAIGGALSGFARGAVGGLRGEKMGKNFTNSYADAMQAKQSRKDRQDDGVGWFEMQQDKFTQLTGGHTVGERSKAVSDDIDTFQKYYDQIKGAITSSDTATITDGHGRAYAGAKEIQKTLDSMVAPTADKFVDPSGTFREDDYRNAVQAYNNQKKDLEDLLESRIGEVASSSTTGSGGMSDRAAQAAVDDAVAAMSKLRGKINSGGRSIDSDFAGITADVSRDVVTAYKQSKGAKTQFTGSSEYAHAQDRDKYASKKGQK